MFLNQIYESIVLNEYEDDINYEYYEEYDELEYEVFNNIASHKKIEFGGKIDPKQYHTALKKFIKMGEVSNFPEKKIFDWKDMVIEHIWLLKIFTEINGHSDGYPVDTFMDVFNDDSTFSDWVHRKNEEAGEKLYSDSGRDWGSFIAFLEEEYNLDDLLPTFANGQLLVSDYGLKPLLTLAYELHSLTDPSEILVCINKILDVTHQRSDLAELFVYGGSEELDFIYDYMGELNESMVINQRTKNNIWYHGSSSPDLTIDTIKINDKSTEMFYGNAFYVASNIELAKKYGKYIYEVEADGDFYNVKSREMLGTYGTFEQYMDTIRDSYVENILDLIKEDPHQWLKKLKVTKKELNELYKDEDSDTLADYYIENNEKDLFDEYLENQIGLRDEYEEDGYDGLMDITQIAIFNPKKSVKAMRKL